MSLALLCRCLIILLWNTYISMFLPIMFIGVISLDSAEREVSLKRNVAYELHKPQSQGARPEQTHTSQILPPIYEEL